MGPITKVGRKTESVPTLDRRAPVFVGCQVKTGCHTHNSDQRCRERTIIAKEGNSPIFVTGQQGE